MQRALVVIDSTDQSRILLQQAGDLAAGVDAHLIVLSTLTKEEYKHYRDVLGIIAHEEHTSYKIKSIEDYADQIATKIANETLNSHDVEYEARGISLDGQDRGTTIVRIAEKLNCDHLFLTGIKRSPTGKAVFGDTTQSVILNFNGLTTVMLDEI